MKKHLTLCSGVLALAIVAYGQDKPKDQPPPDKKPKEAFSDADFLANTNRTNLMEIAMGQLAGTQSTNLQVKEFGQKMVVDHQKMNADLTNLAARKKIKLPGKLTEDEQKMVDDMGKLSGEPFDKRFASHMVSGHEKAVEDFKKASKDAQDADIRAFAAGALPKLEEHLKEAKELRDKIGGAPESPKTDKPKPGEPEKPLPPDKQKPVPPEKPERP